MKEKLYTAGEFANMAGVSLRTIRFYDSKGLLKPVSYSEAGYRYYDRNSFLVLQRIMMLKYLDFSLAQIDEILKTNDDTEEQIAFKYCTSEWLSDIVNFMFDKGYLHLDDITESDSSDDVLSIIPNRYGNFKPVNSLYRQGLIPDKLLDDSLKDTGFDIKEVLLYDGFVLNEKAKITDFQITTLASKYNEYFEGEEDDEKKEGVSNFLLHLVPECGEQYEEIRNLYNVDAASVTVIKTSELSIWKGAKDYMIGLLAEKASECKTLLNIGVTLNNHDTNVELSLDKKIEYKKKWIVMVKSIGQNHQKQPFSC